MESIFLFEEKNISCFFFLVWIEIGVSLGLHFRVTFVLRR